MVRPRRRPTALEQVREQYVAGDRDIDGLERGVEWLLRHRRDGTYETIAAHWPMSADEAPPPRNPGKPLTLA